MSVICRWAHTQRERERERERESARASERVTLASSLSTSLAPGLSVNNFSNPIIALSGWFASAHNTDRSHSASRSSGFYSAQNM